jgi:small-conductance mechanosensitive channel
VNQVEDWLGKDLFQLGSTQVTVGLMLTLILVVAATLLFGRLARWATERYFEKGRGGDAEASRAFGIAARLLVWFVGLEVVLHFLNIRLGSVLAAGGLLALAIGFASKNLIENFLSGSILRLEGTMKTGDLIIVEDRWLVVQRIALRCLWTKSFDGVWVSIPNSRVAQSLIANLTRGDRQYRIKVEVGVAYDSDLAEVRAVLEEAADKLDWRSRSREPGVYVREFSESAVTYGVYVWLDDASDTLKRRSDLHEAVWWALKHRNITIAYPQLDLHVDQEVLDAAAGKR